MTHDLMTCERFADHLMAYLEHETDDSTRAAIERHSITCPECGPLLADLRKLRIDAANLPGFAPSRDLWPDIARRIEAPVVPIGGAGAGRLVKASDSMPARALARWMKPALVAASLVAAAGIGYVVRGTPAVGTPPSPVAQAPADAPRVASVQSVTGAESNVPGEPAASAEPVSREPAARTGVTPSSGTPATPAASTPASGSGRPVEVQLALATLTSDYDREIARLHALIDQRRNQLDSSTVAVIEKNLAVIDTAIAESRKAITQDPSSRLLIEFLNQSLQTKVELMRTAALLPSRARG